MYLNYCKRRHFRISRKYDVSENINHYRLNGIRYKMRENMSMRKGHIGLDARRFSSAKISTFTVIPSTMSVYF